MSELQDLAYIDFRQYVIDNWNKIRLLNEKGEEIFSKPIPNGTRIKWMHTTTRTEVVIGTDLNGKPITGFINVQTNPNMILRVQVLGSELTIPTKIAAVELINTNSHDKTARIKKNLDTIVDIATASDMLTYTMNLDIGETL
ncbi:hypothetical protein ACQKMI_10705 [Lysinibacillus sp. NPDC097214]|uniref:hypothetical protein n=1 Tax=Lysinibacillus sp. NPDC097214 TaxID=3390584 RepID=UPI003D039408